MELLEICNRSQYITFIAGDFNAHTSDICDYVQVENDSNIDQLGFCIINDDTLEAVVNDLLSFEKVGILQDRLSCDNRRPISYGNRILL